MTNPLVHCHRLVSQFRHTAIGETGILEKSWVFHPYTLQPGYFRMADFCFRRPRQTRNSAEQWIAEVVGVADDVPWNYHKVCACDWGRLVLKLKGFSYVFLCLGFAGDTWLFTTPDKILQRTSVRHCSFPKLSMQALLQSLPTELAVS